jgi:hypothetical protein
MPLVSYSLGQVSRGTAAAPGCRGMRRAAPRIPLLSVESHKGLVVDGSGDFQGLPLQRAPEEAPISIMQ